MCSTVITPNLDSVPRFLVAMRHPTARRYVCDLIEQHCRCWLATTPPKAETLRSALDDLRPDALIVEAPTVQDLPRDLPQRTWHLIVIGPEADDAYRHQAVRAGADAWISRDHLGTELIPTLQAITCRPVCSCGCHQHR